MKLTNHLNYNTVFLDAGHGGIDPNMGYYTTTPSKMFTHSTPYNQNGEVVFYEGVKNRLYANRLAEKLVNSGVNVVKVYHPWLDTPLKSRVALADYYHNTVARGVFFSEHSNATGAHTARGFTAYTSNGKTLSDQLSQLIMEGYASKFSNRMLRDTKDGDWDYEEDFYVLRETDMPSVLVENLFFDQIDDAKQLYDVSYMEAYTDLIHDSLIEFLRKLG